MSTEHEAEEHLRAIRQLMERATIYRAISAPTALWGGLLSAGAAALMWQWLSARPEREMNPRVFLAVWVLVLFLTLAANTFYILRSAGRRGEHPISAGMKHALRSVAPSFFAGGAISVSPILIFDKLPPALLTLAAVLVWLIFYGLGLLATDSFAPRSILLLGWAFVCTGVVLFVGVQLPGRLLLNAHLPVAIMGVTFGGYHLCYAVIVWVRDRQRDLDAAEHRPLLNPSYPPLP